MPKIYAKVSEMSPFLALAWLHVATRPDDAKERLSVFNTVKGGQLTRLLRDGEEWNEGQPSLALLVDDEATRPLMTL